jgi:hypothetical protein
MRARVGDSRDEHVDAAVGQLMSQVAAEVRVGLGVVDAVQDRVLVAALPADAAMVVVALASMGQVARADAGQARLRFVALSSDAQPAVQRPAVDA